MLKQMRERGEGFFRFAQRLSLQHVDYFRDQTLERGRRQLFEREARESLGRQQELEAQEQVPFEQFLADYFAQR